jgi:hypothetical protein
MTVPNIPTWLIPSAQGQLANTHGANTTTDAITYKFHFSNLLNVGDTIANLRVQVNRTARFGNQLQTSESLWDSQWTGTPSVQSIPGAASESTPVCTTWNGRVYVLFLGVAGAGGSGNCWSAPLLGGGVGPWRPETNLGPSGVWWGQGGNTPNTYVAGATQMAAVNGWLYAVISNTTTTQIAALLGCQIGPNGLLGTWQKLADAPYALHSGAQFCGGAVAGGPVTGGQFLQTTQPWELVLCGGKNSSGTVVATTCTSGLNADGTLWGWGTLNNIPAARQNGQAYFDNNFPCVYLCGGDDGTNATTALYGAQITSSNGSLQAWATTGVVLPSARTGGALVTTLGPDFGTHLWYLGGSATIGGAATTSIYHTTLAGPGAMAGWTTSSFVLPATSTLICGWSGSTPGSSSWVGQVGDKGGASGATAATAWVCYMAVGVVRSGNVHATSPAFITGNGPGLTTTDMGGGAIATITNNLDGSQDLTFVHGGWGTVKAALDGDQLQVTVTAISLAGDASPASAILLKVGQGPVLSTIAPAGTITQAQPTLSWKYAPGAGGSAEFYWQVQVKLGGTVIFDSGVHYDVSNSVLLTIAPLLAPSTSYTLVIFIFSLDNPVPGSFNVSGSTTTFTTSAFTVPAAPATLTATPSSANANVALAWGTVAAASYYRVYHRRTGASAWTLYADNVVGTSLTAMDHIALGVGYDFAVSAVSSLPAESVKSSTATATIPVGAYSAYLHVATQGATYGVPFQVQGSPTIGEVIDGGYLQGFGQAAPVARYGSVDYRTLGAGALLVDSTPATLKSLQAIMDQVKAGAVLQYRDALGGMIMCALDAQQGVTVIPPWYRQVAIKLTEVPDLIGPYYSGATAQGIPVLANGRRPPLDTSERLL